MSTNTLGRQNTAVRWTTFISSERYSLIYLAPKIMPLLRYLSGAYAGRRNSNRIPVTLRGCISNQEMVAYLGQVCVAPLWRYRASGASGAGTQENNRTLSRCVNFCLFGTCLTTSVDTPLRRDMWKIMMLLSCPWLFVI